MVKFENGKFVIEDDIVENSIKASNENMENAVVSKIDATASSISAKNRFHSDKAIELSKRYNVPLGTGDNSEELLEKEIAAVQSGWEQMGHSLSRLVVSEIGIGTVLGLSDLVDWFANLGNDYGEDDWTNPLTDVLTGWQEAFDERFKIYRENPGKGMDISDSAWWWDNFVQVGSSASLLLPSMGVTKALSLVGKGIKAVNKFTKFDRLLGKGGRALAKGATAVGIEHPYTVANGLSRFTKAAVPSVISRQMEDMLEGRETYKQVYEGTLNQLANMSDEERVEFFNRNRELLQSQNVDISNDESVAKYIADKSAEYTFKNDFKYIGFDFLQFNSLMRFGSKPMTRELSAAQNKLLNRLGNSGVEAATNTGKWAAIKEGAKFYAKNPRIGFTTLAAKTEFTEGLEEIGQGITQENALAEYERFFEPTHSNRTMESLLSDPLIWEQGFWGMAGGIVFQGMGKGFKKLGKEIYKSVNKDKLSDQDLRRLEMTEEKLRAEDIESRANTLEQLQAKLSLFEQGYNPQVTVRDKDGNRVTPDYSNKDLFEKLDEEEKGYVLNEIINEALTNMTVSAVENGNAELLDAFIKDDRFKKYINQIGGSTKVSEDLYAKMTKRFDDVKESYYKNLNTVFGTVDVDNEWVGKALALQMTRNDLARMDVNDELSRIDNKIKTENKTSVENQALADRMEHNHHLRETLNQTAERLKQIDKNLKQIEEDYEKGKINKATYDARRREQAKLIDKYLSNPVLSTIESNAFLRSTINENGETVNEFGVQKWLNYYTRQYTAKTKKGGKFLGYTVRDFDLLWSDFEDFREEALKSINESEREIGKVKDSVAELIDKKVETELMKEYLESEVLDNQEELQEAHDDMYASQLSILANRYNSWAQDVINYIQSADNAKEAFENLMSNNAPKKIQKIFNNFKIGTADYEVFESMFRAAAEEKSEKDDAKVDETENPAENNPAPEPAPVTNPPVRTEPPADDSPSTGEEPQVLLSESEIAAQFDAEAEAQNTPIAPVDEGQTKRLMIGIAIDGAINAALFGSNKVDIKELLLNGTNSEAYKELKRKAFAAASAERGDFAMSDGAIDDIIQNKLAATINMVKDSIDNAEIKAKLDNFVKDLMGLNEEQHAETNLVRGGLSETQEKAAQQFVDTYINSRTHGYKDGKPIVRLDDFLSHLLSIYGDNFGSFVNNILVYLQHNTDKYNIDTRKLKQYINNPKKLVTYLKSLQTKSDILGAKDQAYANDVDFHAQAPTRVQAAERGLRVAMRKGNILEVAEAAGLPAEKLYTIRTYHGPKRYTIASGVQEDLAKLFKEYNDYRELMLSLDNNKNIKVYAVQIGDSISYRADVDGLVEKFGEDGLKELAKIEHANKEIAFIGTVNATGTNGTQTNNTFERVKTAKGKGLFWKVTNEGNGVITSNLDKYLAPIFAAFESNPSDISKDVQAIINLLSDDINENRYYNKEEIELLEKYFELDKNSAIVVDMKDGHLTQNGARDLVQKHLQPITVKYFDEYNVWRKGNFSETYQSYLQKVYDNYSKTYDIQRALNANKEVEITRNQLVSKTVQIAEEEYNISKRIFNAKNNKIAYVKNGVAHIEGRDGTYDSQLFIDGDLGIVIDDNFDGHGTPAIAWMKERNKIPKKSPLYDSLKQVLKNLILETYEGYKDKDGNLIIDENGIAINEGNKSAAAFNRLTNRLIELFGKDSVFYGGKTETENGASTKFVDTIKNFVYNTYYSTIKNNPEYLDKFIEQALDRVNFNGSISIAEGKLSKPNQYISFEDSKLKIKLDKEYTYNNYTDFLISNEAFSINQEIVDDSDDIFALGNGMFFSATVNDVSPVEGNLTIGTLAAVEAKVKKASKTKAMTVRSLLETAGINSEDIDILLGKNSGVSFIKSKVYYDGSRTDGVSALYNSKLKRVYLTNNLFKDKNLSYKSTGFKYDIVRLLIHENVHAKFDELSQSDKQYVSNELSKIFLAFADAIVADTNEKGINQIADAIVDAFEGSRWSRDNIIKLADDIRKNALKADVLEEAMNEFLAETLSQSELIKYLDSKTYNGEEINIDTADKADKSLWQKIVDVIIDFFNNFSENFSINNLENSNNNSIFATEYKLLSSIGKVKPGKKADTKTTNQVDTQQELNFDNIIEDKAEPKTEEKVETVADDYVTTEDDLADIDINLDDTTEDLSDPFDTTEDELFAETKAVQSVDETKLNIERNNADIDIVSLATVSDMQSFAAGFGSQKQAEISYMIESGQVNYVCK